MKLHPKITAKRLERACRASMESLDNPGFCNACGASVEGVEPDARNYECERCGEREVYGAEELLLCGI